MKEPLLAYAVCFLLTLLCVITSYTGGFVSEICWFLAVFSLIAIPLFIVRRIHPRDEKEAGLALQWSTRDFLTGLIVLVILFIPVALGNHFVRTELLHLTFQFSWDNYDQLSNNLIYEVFIQLLVVAFPEEFFYRGYLQTAFYQYFQKRPHLSKFAPAFSIILASACFAAVHFPSGGPSRLLTFFPGLLFGTLRYKTGGLLGCILCHAGCNLMMTVLNVHYHALHLSI